MKKRFTLLLLLFLVLQTTLLQAQVTIGSGVEPVLGALLQLKENENAADNSTRGLSMPRMNLTKKTALYPMFETVAGNGIANSSYDDATKKAAQDAAHTGLVVYNLTNEDDFCPGLYAWDGEQWQKLGEGCFALDIDNLYFDLPSGRDLRPLTAKTSIVSWKPTSATATWVNSASGAFAAVPFTGTAIYPTATLSSSPTTLTFLPDAMNTTTDVTAANPFKTKESKIDVTLGTSGRTETITINQTNKALLVNGSAAPSQILHTANGTGQSIAITSNAVWKMGMTASTAVTNLVPVAGTATGMEKNDNTSVANTQKYDITVGASHARYTTLTFGDNESPKRFNDVSITIAQCSGTNDPTMLDWKNSLIAANGGALAIDIPGANGVAWHQDHEGNIFFSMNYDAANPTGNNRRWMITNLATKTYGARTGGGAWAAPSLTNTYAANTSPYTAAYWGYPGGASASDASKYNARQRLGLLYNYAAANGNQNPSVVDQGGTAHAAVQGICPAGWHLPTDLEWTQLETEVKTNASKYSGLADGTASPAFAMMDMCEPTVGQNSSNGILGGGFAALLAGYAGSGSSYGLGSNGYFWSSSSGGSLAAWNRYFTSGNSAVRRYGYYRTNLFSVRCKKN